MTEFAIIILAFAVIGAGDSISKGLRAIAEAIQKDKL